MAEQIITKAHENAQDLSINLSLEFVIDFIYNSLSFQHGFVSFEDVKTIITEGEGDVKAEHQRLIANHFNALNFMLNLINTKTTFDEEILKDLHAEVMGADKIGGLYRNLDISIKGSNHTPPGHIKVYDRMKRYFYNLENFTGDSLEKAAYAHLELAKIHPFLDGNGRANRLVLNYFLIINGYKPIIIYKDESEVYFNSLEEFKVNKTSQPFIDFLTSKI